MHMTGSLSAAARSMGVTQPAVSAQLQSLERLMGERLFVRGARGVTPTPRADELATRLAVPFGALADALAGARPTEAQHEPPVRLGGASEVLGEVLAPVVGPLIADGLRLQIVPGLTDALVDALRGGALDLVIASQRPRGRTLVATPLVDETFVLVASPAMAAGLPAGGAGTLRAVDLSGVPLLAYAHDLPVLRRYWRHVFGERLEREPALIFPDLRALRDAAVGGAGVTVLPTYLCRAALDSGALVELNPTDDPPINTLYLLRRPGGRALPHVQRVIDMLRGPVAASVADERDSSGQGILEP